MTREEAINEINEVFTPAYANYIVTALTEGATVSDKEHRKGHWITKPHVYGVAFCSECGFELKTNDTNFCPNCGADMRVGEE